MQIIFFGSDQYSAIVLDKLSRSRSGITAVVTTRTSTPNPVEILASKHSLKIFYYPPNLTDLSNLITNDTYGVSASFGRILNSELLHLFPNGIYNLHPSLLPQYRNVAPVPYALAMGDQITGISIFRMNENIDEGQIVAQIKESILPTDTTPILLTRLFTLGSDLLINWLKNPIPTRILENQDTGKLIFTRKLARESGYIEWPVFKKYLQGETLSDTANPLLTLRLNNHPERNSAVTAVSDLFRALLGYERLWTTAPSGKEFFITSLNPLMLQLSGKPKPILYQDFAKYYL